MEIEIRKAKPEDARAWCRIRKECWLDVYPNEEFDITKEDILLKDFDSPAKIQNWQESFIHPRGACKYYSAIINDQVVGMCLAYDGETENEIGAIYIDLKFQGQGIGKKLMNEAMANFDANRKIILKVVSYNEKAINFYKKLGFKIVGPFDDPYGKLPNGKKLPETLMVREVSYAKEKNE